MSRSVKKGPFIEKSLYKKVIEMNKAADRKMIMEAKVGVVLS